jgi:SAM-dependent methyltransferase
MLSAQDWHKRYSQQARWTRDLRAYLFNKAGVGRAGNLLDVGCGTGVIETELGEITRAAITCLDIDLEQLQLARRTTSDLEGIELVQGDALRLPLASARYDVCLCHYVLLWLPDPLQAVREMARVTRPGGSVLLLAEPDYGGRIDYPPELALLGQQQAAALRHQGADPHLGRRLREFLRQAGLQEVESGVLGGQWTGSGDPHEADLEWMVLESDLSAVLPGEELARLRQLDRQARADGQRVLYVPTFYAWGKVSG